MLVIYIYIYICMCCQNKCFCLHYICICTVDLLCVYIKTHIQYILKMFKFIHVYIHNLLFCIIQYLTEVSTPLTFL